MTDTTDKPADTTRQQILRAAAHQFAQRPYHQVGLDDILAEAELTKGAMYFHFRSKHALALAVIDDQTASYIAATQELAARRLSGLETLVDAFYLIAVQEITDDLARAGLLLLEAFGRSEGLQAQLIDRWIHWLTPIVARAVAEGDIIEQCAPQDVARLFVALYVGMRQTGDLDNPEQFFLNLEKAWTVVSTSVIPPDRIGYFRQFIRRRTALAINNTAAALRPA